MARFTDILRDLPPAAFAAVFGASPRREREVCLHRHRVRTPAGRGVPLPQGRAQAKVRALRAILAEVEDEEMCQELLRSWLMGRRPLLAAALDHLGIAHTGGLTDSEEVSRLAGLDAGGEADLRAALAAYGEGWEIDAYLRFMGVGSKVAGGGEGEVGAPLA